VTAVAEDLVRQAETVLDELGFDPARCNERSALTLLALLGIRPGMRWPEATNDLRGVTPLMQWIGAHFGKQYKPNTRETVRRQTLHQFMEVGLVALNPDDPKRAINSSKNAYRVDDDALALLRTVDSPTWKRNLENYLEARPGLIETYAASREQAMIPVSLPAGGEVRLTPGGQNVLIGAIVSEFCPRWTPGGQVVYIGDTGKREVEQLFDTEVLADLGVVLNEHGKLPDLIVYLPGRNWLVLLEAASTHGPVDSKRHSELSDLFADSTAGLVFVSCFPDRAVMRKYLAQIAWETEVWCADTPDHLIHFNGERFLGPYSESTT
jgi:hypothetical protein